MTLLDREGIESLIGHRVTLRPISREDYPLLFKWRSDPSSLHLWSTQRRIVSFEQFCGVLEQTLQDCVFMLIQESSTRRPVGFIHSYGASPEDGFVHFLVSMQDDVRGTGLGAEAAILFADYLFRFFSLRKLYAEAYEFNTDSIQSLSSAGFVQEACLREHVWYDGRYWDMYQFALYRRDADELRKRLQHLFAGRNGRPVRRRTDRSYLTPREGASARPVGASPCQRPSAAI